MIYLELISSKFEKYFFIFILLVAPVKNELCLF